jgi:hypothetical protein
LAAGFGVDAPALVVAAGVLVVPAVTCPAVVVSGESATADSVAIA